MCRSFEMCYGIGVCVVYKHELFRTNGFFKWETHRHLSPESRSCIEATPTLTSICFSHIKWSQIRNAFTVLRTEGRLSCVQTGGEKRWTTGNRSMSLLECYVLWLYAPLVSFCFGIPVWGGCENRLDVKSICTSAALHHIGMLEPQSAKSDRRTNIDKVTWHSH